MFTCTSTRDGLAGTVMVIDRFIGSQDRNGSIMHYCISFCQPALSSKQTGKLYKK